MEVKGDAYGVTYDDATSTVTLKGKLRLVGTAEYDPINELLNEVIGAAPEVITLDLCDLRFLNSAGTNIFFRFVNKVRQQKGQLVVRISAQAAWQKRLLAVMQRLMPQLQVDLDCSR
jgi:hypothetical protein